MTIAGEYLSKGLSIIPIKMPDKSPTIKSWKEYQSRIPTDGELKYGDSIALICGHVSGNVEVVDIDVKNDPDLIARFQSAIDEMQPTIFIKPDKFVAQRTASGGLHIIYRCPTIEGNQKLAKSAGGVVLVETRGEGGYIAIDPTPGYQVTSGSLSNIPTITPQERDEFLAVCRSLNRFAPPQFEPKKRDTDKAKYNGESPGDAYNRTGSIEELLEPLGWRKTHRFRDNDYWRRPGKDSGHSASWNGHVFYVFSSSTVLESEKGFNLFSLRSILIHNGDFSACARELYAMGYGDRHERQIISANDEIRAEKEAQKKIDEEKKQVEHQMVYLTPSIKANNKFAHVFVSSDNVCTYFESGASGKASELLRQRIAQEIGDLDIWPKVNNEGMRVFDESWIQRDTDDSIYLYYQNGTIQVFADKVVFTQGLDRNMVWDSLVLNRNYKPCDELHPIAELAQKATVNYETLQIGLGYLLHRNWKRNATKVVWAVDYMPESRNDGRRGKDLFTTIVSLCRKWVPVKWKRDHNFWTSSIQPDTAIVHFEDVSNFLATDDEFKKTITGDLNIEYKGANILTRKFSDKPKFSASSQLYPADYMDNSIRGRIWLIEFTDYLQKNPPPKVLVYDDKDLAPFDKWIIECCQVYLRNKDKMIGVPKLTPEQRQQCIVNKFSKRYVEAVDEVRNELQIEEFIPTNKLFEIIGTSKNDPKSMGRFLEAFKIITGEELIGFYERINGTPTRGYRYPIKKDKIFKSSPESPF